MQVLLMTLMTMFTTARFASYNEDDSEYIFPHQNGEMTTSRASNLDIVTRFLNLVERYEQTKENCTTGTGFNLGDGVVQQYGVRRFKRQALTAVNRANLLTRIWIGAPPSVLNNEYLFYTYVRNMVEGDDDIFAAGNCYDYKEFKDYTLFCPYAYRLPNGQIMVKDLSIEYKYLKNDSEWFYQARKKGNTLSRSNLTIGEELLRVNESYQGPLREVVSLSVRYEDGHWSLPYFDCGGGNIWMMTYTVPFFGYDAHKNYKFKGTSGIDIDLQKVDIDQCPHEGGDSTPNVFAGSAKCKKETTMCEPVPGLGFRRGSYKCICKMGYYFPDPSAGLDYFNGTEIEIEFEKHSKNLENRYLEYFDCFPCALGCDECVDDSPCIISLDWLQRSILLGITCAMMSGIPVIMWFVWAYREIKVLKAASPVLLKIILLGAMLLYSPMIVSYFEPTEITCSLRLWLREIGFSISYGALLLKTWRISMVFRVKSAQRIKISDTDLIKRLAFITFLFCAWMSVRTVVGRPKVIQGKHSSGLKAFQCSFDVWDYCAAIAELFLLLWGIRLCIVVRKAPSEFNESRFISWAIYNEFLLSLFLNISMLFLQSPSNPDLLYLVLFLHTQLTTTVTLAFLFGSKAFQAYVVYKNRYKEQAQTTISRGSKYMAAPKGVPTSTVLSTVTTAGAAPDKKMDDHEYCNSIEKELQDEFFNIHMKLELLKQKNLKFGNTILARKIATMCEVITRTEDQLTTCTDSVPSTPNINGKRVVISLDEYTNPTSV
ncbi:metabotropic glycine receptor-like [Tubulanus polymorphus]|uniref:metabotropic glycine receptor-like n=1 Tax=Tubulanus polymorphus TaxID=672921 RepID=UPI003DA39F22